MSSQRGCWVCWISKNTCLKSGLIRNDACARRTAAYPNMEIEGRRRSQPLLSDVPAEIVFERRQYI